MGSKNHAMPGFYGKNIVKSAQNRYLSGKKTTNQIVHDHRDSTANVVVMCILAALNNVAGIGQVRLDRVIDKANHYAELYAVKKNILGDEKAKAELETEVAGIMPPDGFVLPYLTTPKKKKDWILQYEKRDSGELVAMLYAKAIHKVLGFGAERIKEVLDNAMEVYREFGEYAKDGDYYGYKVLADRMTQIMHTQIDVDESEADEPIFGDSLT